MTDDTELLRFRCAPNARVKEVEYSRFRMVCQAKIAILLGYGLNLVNDLDIIESSLTVRRSA